MSVPLPGPAPRPTAIDQVLGLYAVLRAGAGPMRVSELSGGAGLSRRTTCRLLDVLVAAGLAARFGMDYLATAPGGDRVRPEPGAHGAEHEPAPRLGELAARTGLTVSLAVLDEAEVVFTQRAYGTDNAWTPSDGSGRACAFRTAAGRLLLAADPHAATALARASALSGAERARLGTGLAAVGERGFAHRENAGLTCLAVAVPTAPGRPPMALTVKGRTGTYDQDGVLRRLRRAAGNAAGVRAPRS
ncbi:hypothetical protein ACFRI7_02635 [Streptomyces sp. NPDC056716]|uniref:IclR family transcriptional regulator domain-containing protein n=1 Tax=unclassified Streptomyces TaxID=2593676 RepID=UPI003685A15B